MQILAVLLLLISVLASTPSFLPPTSLGARQDLSVAHRSTNRGWHESDRAINWPHTRLGPHVLNIKRAIDLPGRAPSLDCHSLVSRAGFWYTHVAHPHSRAYFHAEKPHVRSDLIATGSDVDPLGFHDCDSTVDFSSGHSYARHSSANRPKTGRNAREDPEISTVGEPFYPKGGTPIYVKAFLEDRTRYPRQRCNHRRRPSNESVADPSPAPTG